MQTLPRKDKKWERFRRPNPIKVSAERPGMTSTHMRDVVHDFKPRLLVEIRITPVDSDGKRVSHCKVRLRTDDGEIEATPRVLRSQFVHQSRTERPREICHHSTAFEVIIFEGRGEVK